ncbi:short-chain dehydrogenase/reductase SDR [Chthoniobacter flavus Ellin428]|uniref:Short-chain dehydrogenase/reductase SDR n=1 Tax=Chthoniobacter flavus Ellin428 TaxID=497964 RepID=B4CVV4_9BACT|nr:SDR family NAD(P)-dependent oxidoreductase [Chthoniobacter flavus]EDY21546.1 short-chain dehydrogenase/reductase SDR [Chthoniobacter flavus Ellin428]
MSNLFDLSQEVAVIIGATGVLGGALADGLAAAGAKVAVLGRNAERGEARAQAIRKAGGIGQYFAADALDRASLAKAHEVITRELGAPTVLVNAAGGNDPKVTVTPERPFESINLDDWRTNFEMNLVGGVLLPCQEFGPAMAQRGKGSIINIASVSAHLPLSRVVAYSSSKAAVISLSQFLAREWATKGVRVNTINPWLLPGGTKPQAALQRRWHAHRAHEIHLGPHAHEPLRRIAGIDRRRRLPRRAGCQQLYHRHGHPRRWRAS